MIFETGIFKKSSASNNYTNGFNKAACLICANATLLFGKSIYVTKKNFRYEKK
jgi:hypothetical protein